jgi:tetratricopeptide (TPR) repeat protein
MSLQRQYPAGDRGQPDRFEGPFVGRDEHLRAFAHAIEAQEPEDLRVLVYHGIGGIGKSRIADELGRMLDGESSKAEDMDLTPDPAPGSQFCWAKIDFEVSRRRKPALGLYHLRTRLSGKYGFHFPTFDLAFAQYWSKAYPEAPLPKPDPSFLEEHGDFALALLDAVGEVPVAGLLAKIPKHVDRLGEKAMDLYRKRNVEALQGVSALPAHEIEECLPRLWTYDFKNQISKAERRAVIFFDTYEALREDQSAESKRHQADRWIRKFVKRLPGTLIVVTGHEKLYWPEVTKDWGTVLRQRHLQELSSPYVRSFLKASGIDEKAIRDRIVETISGIPFDWDWAVQLYREIRRKGKEPTPEDFGETPWELHRRFFRYIQDDEMAMLELLAVPRTFSRPIVQALVESFDPGFPVGQFSRLKRFAFINQVDESGIGGEMYAVHDRARNAIREHGPFLSGQEKVHEFLFEYHAERLADLKPREIGPTHNQSLQEAFYHGRKVLNIEELGKWFHGAAEVFMQAGDLPLLEVLYVELLKLQEATLDEDNPAIAATLHNRGEVHRQQANFSKAEDLFERALTVRKSVLSDQAPEVAETLSKLGVVYNKIGDREEAETRLKEALDIQNREYNKKQDKVAETLNNLGNVYRRKGEYEKARYKYDEALEIRRSILGEGHFKVENILNNLAVAYSPFLR